VSKSNHFLRFAKQLQELVDVVKENVVCGMKNNEDGTKTLGDGRRKNEVFVINTFWEGPKHRLVRMSCVRPQVLEVDHDCDQFGQLRLTEHLSYKRDAGVARISGDLQHESFQNWVTTQR
jgi:hypothetical protein